MIVLYTIMYGVAGGGTAYTGDVNVAVPDIKEVHHETSYNDGTPEPENDPNSNGIFFAIIGAIASTLCVIALPFTFGLSSLGLGVTTGIMVIGGTTVAGYAVGYLSAEGANYIGLNLPWLDFIEGLSTFFGGILDLLTFIVGFATFGVIGNAFVGMPAEFYWIGFIMTFPVWVYFMIIIAGFCVDIFNSAKSVI